MLKIMTLVGTRPELIKMSRVIAELDRHFNHILVHSGQNYDYRLNKLFFEELRIRPPDYYLNAAKDNAIETIANILTSAADLFQKEKPDALVLYGDTNSCLAAIAAKKHKIPIFHMEAGNRCFDERVPEELNRKLVDHMSDVNLVLSEHARVNLLKEGMAAQTIIKTGSHMPEVLNYYAGDIEASTILSKEKLQPRHYFLVSCHREENIDDPGHLKHFIASLHQLQAIYNLPIIVSTHPRTKKSLENIEEKLPLVRFLPPFGFFDYVKLQMNAKIILSDSGTLMEEAALLNLPAVMIRVSHERPEGMDAGTLVVTGLEPLRVLAGVKLVIKQHDYDNPRFSTIPDYQKTEISAQIARIILSHI